MAQEHKYNPNNLIVNYIPQNMTDEEFKSLFETVGPVKASRVIRDKTTGVSYGFGFVEYEIEEDSGRAIDSLNGLQMQNKKIKVAYARQGENMKGANVYVRYLPKNFTSADLEQTFQPFGDIISARVLTDNNTGLSRGVGFVLFNTRDEATTAIQQMDGKPPHGYTQGLSVKFAEDNKLLKMQQHVAMLGLRLPTAAPFSPGAAPFSPGASPFAAGPYGAAGHQGMSHRLPGSPTMHGLSRSHSPAIGNNFGGPGNNFGGPGNNFGGAGNTFGAGYQGMFGGGPLRTNSVNQRYNPLSNVMPHANGGNADEFVLFAYNIGINTDEKALWQLFSPFGAIKKVNVVRDNEKKIGKGFGFVTMFDYQEALTAIQHLNGTIFAENKPLQVSLKKPKS